MGDDYDEDGMYGFDDDWLYVEDEFGLADELAETQIADPGYSGTNEEINHETFEYDHYEFWDDLEYANDEYWDYGGGLVQSLLQNAGHKRKWNAAESPTQVQPGKRLKIPGKQGHLAVNGTYSDEYDTVVFRSLEQRTRLGLSKVPVLEAKTSRYSFMADWRTRFADSDPEFVEVKAEDMPVDMRQAAEVQDEDIALEEEMLGMGGPRAAEAEDDEEELAGDDGDEEDDEGEGEGEDEEDGIALDPEMLKKILRERLGAAGLDGMDETAFMQTLGKMLSGEGEADDAAGALADRLLGQANNESGSALTGWLAGQGVNLDAAGEQEDDDASSVATGPLPLSETSAIPKGLRQDSSPDSAIAVAHGRSGASTSEMALHPSSPESRKAQLASTSKDDINKVDKKVKFDVPDSSPAPGNADGPAPPPAAAADDEDNETIQVKPKSKPAKAPSKSKAKATPAAKDTKKKQPTAATKTSKPKPSEPPAPATSQVVLDDEDEVDDDDQAADEPSRATRQTRKRKVAADEPEPSGRQATRKKANTAPAPAKATRSSARTKGGR